MIDKLFYKMGEISLHHFEKQSNFGFKIRTVTHPPTLDNLFLQVCGCYDQHTDGLRESKNNNIRKTLKIYST